MKSLLFDSSHRDALNGGGLMSLGAIDSEKCGKPPEWRSNANKKCRIVDFFSKFLIINRT